MSEYMCTDCVLLKQISPFVGVPRGSSRFSQHTHKRKHNANEPSFPHDASMEWKEDGCAVGRSVRRCIDCSFGQPAALIYGEGTKTARTSHPESHNLC